MEIGCRSVGYDLEEEIEAGFPEERTLAELFSVKPIGGFGIGLLKSETMRSIKWSLEASAAAGVVDQLSCGGPRRL